MQSISSLALGPVSWWAGQDQVGKESQEPPAGLKATRWGPPGSAAPQRRGIVTNTPDAEEAVAGSAS